MYILFTTSNSLLSRMIRSITGERMSHCAVELDGIVYHSDLLGVHLETTLHFYRTHQVVGSIYIDSEKNLHKAIESYEFAGYDYGALLYLGLRYLLRITPKANLWQSTGMFLCTEWVQEVLGMKLDSLMTPYQLYTLLKGINK